MYVAVLANINGNFPALMKALGKIEELKEDGYDIEKYYIMGNIIGLFPYPKEIVDALEDLIKMNDVKVIRGKYDQIIAESGSYEDVEVINAPDYVKRALKYTWEKLGHEGREFIRELPIYLVDKIGKNEIFGVYGSPLDPINGEVLPEQPSTYYDAIMRPMKKYEILFVASPKWPVNAPTRYGRVICPGSVGLPPAKEHKATFAIVDVDTLHTKFIEVDYESEKRLIEEKIRKEGLPEEIIKILYHGRV
ncbi:phosphatase-like protein [Palaeococcus pacificus DY20341]|uniref:Phosphatase-like protein n=1 Tax=Palaeococcus pacificus DY20341 TaxID=1343739 RepID=A0A075LT64_9EURY|nr:metallophosphoesterase [Palaeococcus pacificus]AIF69955.1 phosphatase-like protein [Palaeococcus pacificus DY20341]